MSEGAATAAAAGEAKSGARAKRSGGAAGGGGGGGAAPLKLLAPSCCCSTCDSPSKREAQLAAELQNPQAGMWRHSWRAAGGSGWTISGHSRALERTGFCIEELRIFLDAGVGWRDATTTVDAILLTHGHIDHCNALPMLLRCGLSDPAVFVPRMHVNNVREMCRMTWSVKRPDGSSGAGRRADAEELPDVAPFRRPLSGDRRSSADSSGSSSASTTAASSPRAGASEDVRVLPAEQAGIRDWAPEDKKGRLWVPVDHGCQFMLLGKKQVVVKTVKCFHSTQDIGYVICETVKSQRGRTPALDTEFERLKLSAKNKDKTAGQEIAKMRKEGDIVTVEEVMPRVAYLFDTTAQVLGACEACRRPASSSGASPVASDAAGAPTGAADGGSNGGAAKGAGGGGCPFAELAEFGEPCCLLSEAEFAEQAELIFSCPTIMIECSFIGAGGMSDAEADTEAIKRTHTSWPQLRPFVEAHPSSKFLLAHFSKRYTDQDIREYFSQEKERGGPTNVVLWLDSGVVDMDEL